MPRTHRLSAGGIALLREPNLAHLATTMADGAPQVTPVWIDVEDDGSHVLVNTAVGRLKHANSQRDPRVALSVNHAGDFYRYLVLRGRIVEERLEGAEEHYVALARRYLGSTRQPRRQPGEVRLLLRIAPETVLERGL